MSSALLPETILTVSPCITDTMPDRWTLAWKDAPEGERSRLQSTWAIDRDRLAAIEGWADEAYADKRLLWRDMFASLDAARDFLDWLGGAPDHALIFGIGLHPSQRDELIQEQIIPDQEAQNGLVEMIRRGAPMPGGGIFLGWEILGFEYGGVRPHSWLCNGLEVDFNERLGIRPNRHGLIDDWAKAAEAARICNDPQTGAEPVDWWAWAVVQYSPHRPDDEAL